MARDFPSITDLGSAVRFALEAELAGADFAAAAQIIAPDDVWREKLDELTCGHDDRLQKLRRAAEQVGDGTAPGLNELDGSAYAGSLGAEPAPAWPAAGEQMAAVEDAIAAYHEALVGTAAEALGDKAHLFAKAAEQARAAAADLRTRLA